MSKSTPKAPDYTAAAQQQGEANRQVTEQQTWANRPDQITPWSNETWQNTPQWDASTGQYINRWQQQTVLNPELQRALDAQMQLGAGRSELGAGMMGRAQNEFGAPVDWGGFDAMGGRVGAGQLQAGFNPSGPDLNPAERYRQDANDAIFNQWADRAMPQQERDTDAMRTQLYNMGFKEGDQGYDRELEKLRQTQGDAMRQAQYQATIGSGAEAQRMLGMDAATRGQLTAEQQAMGQFANQAAGQQFGQNMQASQYDTQRRQQQIAEELQRRGWSLNEINALISGQQVAMPSMPGFQTAGSAQAPQYLQSAQMQGQTALDAFNAKQGGLSGLMSGLGSLGMGAAMMSDRRLKTNVVKIGEYNGHNVYSFDYIWGEPAVGFMADEVPHAIAGQVAGYDYIDLGRV
jgi:hypothetical protein